MIQKFNAITVKIPASIVLNKIDKIFLKFRWKCKVSKITRSILKIRKLRESMFLNIQISNNCSIQGNVASYITRLDTRINEIEFEVQKQALIFIVN